MINKSMKNLFFKTLRNKQIGIAIIAVILFVSVLSAVLLIGTKQTVALSLNGKQLEIETNADTVGDLLAEQDIQVSDADFLTPSLNTLIEEGLSVKWEQAKEIMITVDGQIQTHTTVANQVSEILEEAGIEVSENDKLTPTLDAKVGPDSTIAIEKAFEVTLKDGLDEKKVWSTSTTVADFLKQQEIQLNEFDRVGQRMEELVIPNYVIQVVRVEKVTDVVEEATNFAVETKKDSNLLKGKEKVVQEGKKGTKELLYEITKENGKAISRILKSEKVIKEPSKKVVAVGTKIVTASVSRSTTSAAAPTGGKEFYVTATAYTAFCNGCSGITATGINLRANPGLKVIAVDPRVIPLGSKVWVEGYGYAIAGDTGGAIKGMKIDLFIPNTEQAFAFGRKQLRIKILN